MSQSPDKHSVIRFVLSSLEPENPSIQFLREYRSLGGLTLVFSNATVVDPQQFADAIQTYCQGKVGLDLPEIKITLPHDLSQAKNIATPTAASLGTLFLLLVLGIWCLALGVLLFLYVTGIVSLKLAPSTHSPDAPLHLQANQSAPLRHDHAPFLQQKKHELVRQVLAHHLSPHLHNVILSRVSEKCEYAQGDIVSPVPLVALHNMQRDMRLAVFKISVLLSSHPPVVRFYFSTSATAPPLLLFRKPPSSTTLAAIHHTLTTTITTKRKRQCDAYCSCACCIDLVRQRVARNFHPVSHMSSEKRQRLVALLAEAELLQGASTPLYAGGVYYPRENVVRLEKFDSLDIKEVESLVSKAQGIVKNVFISPQGFVELALSE